jgi:glycosyltransferase involved in cell wall biosynthesis
LIPARAAPLVVRAGLMIAGTRRRITRNGSAAPARAAIGNVDRTDHARWHRATSDQHERYRAANPPADDGAAAVCVSMRPHLIDQVIANFARQSPGLRLHVIFVPTHPDFASVDLERKFAGFERLTILEPPVGTSLGTALNLAIDSTDERFVAKFDDDDWYGRGYLIDSLRAHGYAGAGIVGKHAYYADVASTGGRYLRFPAHEFRYSAKFAGGTLVLDRERLRGVRFEDRSYGEDRIIVEQCNRRGISTFSADRFNFVQYRGDDHTWRISDDEFIGESARVDPLDVAHVVERPA